MNFRSLSSLLGLIIIVLAFFIFIFFLIAMFAFQEESWRGFIDAFYISFIIGAALVIAGGKIREENVTFREGFAVVGLGWIVIAFFGALPSYITGQIPSFTDAYFESMSGFTTTGASILNDIEHLEKTILLWRSFTHWLGGMGFVVFSLAILPALGIGGMQLYKAEVPGPTPDKLMPRVGQTARILYLVYTGLTVVQVVLYQMAGMNLFEALCHTFGSMGTGGFSPLNKSIGQYGFEGNPQTINIELITIVFMFLAGTNFSLHFKALKGNFRGYLTDPEFKFYIFLIVFATISISINLIQNNKYSESNALRHALFTVVSIITTTGYATEDFDRWPNYSRFLLLMLMFIGGMAGSTGGGIKVIRILTLFKESIIEIARTVHPRKVYVIRFGKIYIPKEILNSMNQFVIIYILLYMIGVLVLAATGYDFETVASMVTACFSNIGPGLSKVGPSQNFAFLPDYAKWILSYMMVLGRLEIFPVLVLSLPKIWTK